MADPHPPLQSAARFCHRVDDFVGYRPDYPPAGHPQHQPMLQALRELFDRCAERCTVSFDDDTRIFAGQLA